MSLFVGTERKNCKTKYLKEREKKKQEREIEMFVIVRIPLFSITNGHFFLHFSTVFEFNGFLIGMEKTTLYINNSCVH